MSTIVFFFLYRELFYVCILDCVYFSEIVNVVQNIVYSFVIKSKRITIFVTDIKTCLILTRCYTRKHIIIIIIVIIVFIMFPTIHIYSPFAH